MNKIKIIGTILVLVFLLGGGILFYKKSEVNNLLAHRRECEQKLSDFQKRVVDNGNAIHASFDTHKYFDFTIGYSQKLNTCVGGYTDASQDIIHGRDQYVNDYLIYDVLTNKLIDTFSIDQELSKHPELNNSVASLDAADQYAWEDYKGMFSDLINEK